MKKTIYALVFLCLVAVSTSIFGQEVSTPSEKLKCPVCGMLVAMFADTNATIQFKDSSEVFVFDCSKCMFKYYLNLKKFNPSKTLADVASITVKDHYSREVLDAQKAYYVIWSLVYGPMGHEPIPFGKEEDARKFLKENRGKSIISFKDVNMRLIRRLDNP
jgi:copper chaperone NosL